ncbi:MAG: hypothetical protein BJ554DRAFT_2314, partial [Olpidium bornovanus]
RHWTQKGIIYECFQGEVRVETQTVGAVKYQDAKSKIKEFNPDRGESLTHFRSRGGDSFGEGDKRTVSGDLSVAARQKPSDNPLSERHVVLIAARNYQVPLVTLLQKFDGKTAQESQGVLRRYRITKLPRYLIFHIKRFTKNNWAVEKNPTIVNFPIRNIDMSDVSFRLRAGLAHSSGELAFCLPYRDRNRPLARLARPGLPADVENPPADLSTHYDLIANIVHEGGVADKNGVVKKKGALKIGGTAEGQGVYKVHVRHKARDQWYQIQDLFVEEVMPQMIFLSESYVQRLGVPPVHGVLRTAEISASASSARAGP